MLNSKVWMKQTYHGVCNVCWILGECENGASLLGSDVYVRFLRGLSAAIREVRSGHRISLWVCGTQFCFRGYDKMCLSDFDLCFMALSSRMVSLWESDWLTSFFACANYFELQNQFQLQCNTINTPVYVFVSFEFWSILSHLRRSRLKMPV